MNNESIRALVPVDAKACPMTVTVWASLFRPAEGREVTLLALMKRVRAPRTYDAKDDVPRWSFGTYRNNYRNLASFVSASGLALDIDTGATRNTVVAAFGDLIGFLHTTWRHTPQNPRWRLGVVLSRPIDRDEHDRCWRALASLAEQHGITPDYQGKDACHAWALPARHAEDNYDYVELTGAVFDVEAALARFPAPAPETTSQRRDDQNCPDAYAIRLERASKYLARMPGALSGSGGHSTTFRAAVALVRGFELSPDDALRLLTEIHNPLCAPAWSAWELKHKVRQAHQRARVPFGAIADRPLERRSA